MTLRRTRQDGFTLLEVLAALSVFLIGILGVISLFTSGTRLHQQSQNLVEVTDVVDRVVLMVERELSLAPVQEQTGLPAPVQNVPVPGLERYSYSWSVRAAEISPPYILDLELTWLEGGRPQVYRTQVVAPALRTMAHEVRQLEAKRR